MMQYLVISQCLVVEQSCSTPVDTRGDNDIHVCRDPVMHHMLNYLHGGTCANFEVVIHGGSNRKYA